MDEARRIIDRYEQLAEEWRKVEPAMRAIGHYLNPEQNDMRPSATSPHQGFQSGIYSSYPVVFRDQMASQLYSTMVNPANEWMGLTIPDKDLATYKPVRDFLEAETNLVLYSFSTERSTFYTNVLSLIGDWVTMGQGLQLDEYDDGLQKIVDRTLPLGKALIDRDADDNVSAMLWLFDLTPDQAAMKYGKDALPPKIRARVGDPKQTMRSWFIHAVEINDRYELGRGGKDGKPVRTTTVCRDENAVVKTGGFYEMPVTAPPWRHRTGQTYAQGLGHTVFAAARLVNLQEEAITRAGQFAAQPVNLAASQRVLPKGAPIRPGTTLYGAMVGGRRNFDQIGAPASIPITIGHQESKIAELRTAMHGALFDIQNRTGMTNEEWFDQHANQLQQMAPMLTNLEALWILPKVERRYATLKRMGLGAPIPQELAGSPLELSMKSAASLALRASDGAATMRFLQDIAPLAGLSADAARRVDARVDPDGVMEVMQQARGAPSRILRSVEDADAIAEQQAQQEAMREMMAAAPDMAGAAADLASAEGVQ